MSIGNVLEVSVDTDEMVLEICDVARQIDKLSLDLLALRVFEALLLHLQVE
jgi:hypothetical protein